MFRPPAFVLAVVLAVAAPRVMAQPELPAPGVVDTAARPAPTRVEQEQFLRDAKVTRVRGVGKGITGTQRATLSTGSMSHDTSIQSIDESAARFESAQRVEFNFRDYWGYNVAAYRLGVMLGLDMIPPSVERNFRGKKASFTWWVDDVVMDEGERTKRKREPPDAVYWNTQMYIMRVFDELIANTDRNAGNMLIDTHWKLWLIDHSRAFRTTRQLAAPVKLIHCERTVLTKLKGLTASALRAELGEYLTVFEIEALLERRDRIVERIEALGPAAQYDFRRPGS